MSAVERRAHCRLVRAWCRQAFRLRKRDPLRYLERGMVIAWLDVHDEVAISHFANRLRLLDDYVFMCGPRREYFVNVAIS